MSSSKSLVEALEPTPSELSPEVRLLNPELPDRGDEEIIEYMGEVYSALSPKRGVPRFQIFQELVEDTDPNYTDISREYDVTPEAVGRTAETFREFDLLDRDGNLGPKGEVFFKGFNYFLREGPSLEIIEEERIEGLTDTLSSLSKSRGRDRSTKLKTFLLKLDQPEKGQRSLAVETGVRNLTSYFQDWQESDMMEKREVKNRPIHYPTEKAWRAEGMISYQFKELWLLREFRNDVREVSNKNGGEVGRYKYGMEGSFDPDIHEYLGYSSWKDVIEDI